MCDICVNELSDEERASLPAATRIAHGLPVPGHDYKRVPWGFGEKRDEDTGR